MATLRLDDATLIDGTGRDPVANAHVVVQGTRIAGVGAGPSPSDAGEAASIDCGGLTVLPGLIDLHSHMGVVHASGPAAFSPAVTAAHLFNNARLCIESGHTTAREVAGADGGL